MNKIKELLDICVPVVILFAWFAIFALLIAGFAVSVHGQSYLTPVYPGTAVQDYSQQQYRIQGQKVVPVFPGTNAQDFRQPEYRINGREVYPVFPGTNARDFTGQSWIWE